MFQDAVTDHQQLSPARDLAIMAGKGHKIEWDGNKATNLPALNVHLRRVPRAGWEYPA